MCVFGPNCHQSTLNHGTTTLIVYPSSHPTGQGGGDNGQPYYNNQGQQPQQQMGPKGGRMMPPHGTFYVVKRCEAVLFCFREAEHSAFSNDSSSSSHISLHLHSSTLHPYTVNMPPPSSQPPQSLMDAAIARPGTKRGPNDNLTPSQVGYD